MSLHRSSSQPGPGWCGPPGFFPEVQPWPLSVPQPPRTGPAVRLWLNTPCTPPSFGRDWGRAFAGLLGSEGGYQLPQEPWVGAMVPPPHLRVRPQHSFLPLRLLPSPSSCPGDPSLSTQPLSPSLFLLLHPSPCGDPCSCPVLFSFGETILSHLPGPPLATLTHLPFPATNLPGPPSTCISHSGLNSAAAVTPWLLHFPWMTQHDPVPAWGLGDGHLPHGTQL